MKKFLLTLGCALLGASAFSAEPLVKNGSFENGLTGWVVPSWIKNAAKPQLDNSDMPGAGTASLKMVAADGKLPIIYQVVRFPAGVSQYKVSFKAKTEKFSNWGFVILYISSDKAKKRCFEKVISAQHGVKNSIPWTTYQGVLNVPAEAMNGTGKVTIQFGSKVTGTAWFDDLTIEPVQATPPAPAKVNEKQQPAPAKADAGKKK